MRDREIKVGMIYRTRPNTHYMVENAIVKVTEVYETSVKYRYVDVPKGTNAVRFSSQRKATFLRDTMEPTKLDNYLYGIDTGSQSDVE